MWNLFIFMKITKDIILTKLKEKDEVLMPRQGKLSIPIIKRICKKMNKKLLFKSINVSSDNTIIDGHHRYISSLLTNFDIDIISNYPKPSYHKDYHWENVEFVDDDWDSPSKVKMLNEEDAFYNKMTISEVENIIK